MTYLNQDRREFLKRSAIAIVATPFLLGCRTATSAHARSYDILRAIKANAQPQGTEARGAIDAPQDTAWNTTIAAAEGEPMLISGTVFKSDGKTPAPNILIYFYHTDMYGFYGCGSEPKHGKYRGWMLTDAKGRYEFRSIRPASYPNTTFAAHIHMTITGIDFKEDSIESILFEGDQFITRSERENQRKRGGFDSIVNLEKGRDAIARATRNIKVPV